MQGQGQGQEQVAGYRGYGEQPYPYGSGYGGGGIGFFGDDGSDREDASDNNVNNNSAATNAVAELFAVRTLRSGGGPVQGGRVGMAAFQNSDLGVECTSKSSDCRREPIKWPSAMAAA